MASHHDRARDYDQTCIEKTLPSHMTSRPVTLSIIAFILVPVLLQQIKEVKKDVA